MQFMRSEFLGPENKAYKALLAAGSPEDAAQAVNSLYERSADTTDHREKAARQLMTQFGGDSGAGSGALSFSPEEADDSDSNTPALSTNTALGKGALQTIMPEADSAKSHKWSAGLTGIGAALASISNPQQAYALQTLQKQLKNDETNSYKISVTKDGRIVRVNPSTGQVDAIGGPAASAAAPATIGDFTKTGNDYLSTVPVGQRAIVQGIAEGTIPPGSQYKLGDPNTQALLSAAHQYDPSFDGAAWSGRVAGQKDWASGGKSADIAKSLNQSIGHLSDLPEKFDALHNGFSPMMNEVGNYINQQVRGKTGVTGFQLNAHAVADEMGKLFKGAGLSDREIKQWEAGLGPNMSPDQQRESMRTLSGLVRHSMSALEEKRRQAIGPMAATKKGPLLDNDAQAALAKLDKWAGSDNSAAPASTTIDHSAIDAELKRRGL